MEQFNSTTRAPLDGGAPMPHFSMGNRGSLERASFQNNHMAASLPPVHSQMNNCRFPNLNSMEVRSISFLVDGVCFTFGLLFTEFLEYFGESKGKTSLLGSVLNGAYLSLGRTRFLLFLNLFIVQTKYMYL